MKTNRNLTWQVSHDRWEQAQEWELNVWRGIDNSSAPSLRGRVGRAITALGLGRNNASLGDDWNEWWAKQFDQYQAIPCKIDNAIELGCGPYTNVRIISRERTIRRIYCSDPLARHYASFKLGWLASAYHNRQILLDDHLCEDVPFADSTFDLTIMINVLDHVRDAEACLASAARITKGDGLFVFGQDLTDDTDPGHAYKDVGHPIMLDHEEIDGRLLPAFDVQLRKVLPREQGRNPEAHYGTYIFIGRRKTSSITVL